ncbi:MAG: AMP-binding protein [Burkholderiales bacterium]|jgi:acetyl-CoA synthetase|nr:AMP-binding protein [Burkholderiales bacterium]
MTKTARADQYATLYRQFRWHVPREFNIATVCGQRWAAESSRVAIHHEDDSGRRSTHTYAALVSDAQRLSHALRALGVERGDRVAIVLPQRPETAIAHLAIYQLGAIAMPLSVLFGPDALEYRLQNSEAIVAICDDGGAQAIAGVRANCPALKHVITVGADVDGAQDWSRLLSKQPDRFEPVSTLAEDPAVLIYTSGTTGPPKGALIPHAALIGNLPGFVASQNWFPRAGDVFWSPADWAWTGGLMDALLPTLYFGFPIVSYRGRFSADKALELMQRYWITNSFLFPTALKLMMRSSAWSAPSGLKLRAIMSAGESVGTAVFDWTRSALGITVNEMFGQTEVNYIVGNSHERWPARPGAMGRPYPGHRVAVIDDAGRELPRGEVGDVAIHRRDIHGTRDPIFFLGYWRNERATLAKFTGTPDNSWCRTGDLATMDATGDLWYQGRADDVFKAAGYRIGPGEIENCLIKHPAVVNAAAVPKPDAERGAVVKAFVVLAPGMRGNEALVAELQAHVRGKLAPYEYPKEIEFIGELPMTTTGKVQRRVLRELEAQRAKDADQRG